MFQDCFWYVTNLFSLFDGFESLRQPLSSLVFIHDISKNFKSWERPDIPSSRYLFTANRLYFWSTKERTKSKNYRNGFSFDHNERNEQCYKRFWINNIVMSLIFLQLFINLFQQEAYWSEKSPGLSRYFYRIRHRLCWKTRNIWTLDGLKCWRSCF